jgi:hypothetical protein
MVQVLECLLHRTLVKRFTQDLLLKMLASADLNFAMHKKFYNKPRKRIKYLENFNMATPWQLF